MAHVMKYVQVYDPDTKSKQTIPLAELSPLMVRGQLPDGSAAWIDATKVKLRQKVVQPPLIQEHKKLLQQIKLDLDEVFPCTLEKWELDLRCDQNCERELHIWRWIAHRFKQLTDSYELSPARKKDVFQLCLRWTMTKSVEAALATTTLNELSQEEARALLDSFCMTDAGFFGGPFAQFFPTACATDFSVIKSLDEFKMMVAPPVIIQAVDWSGCGWGIVHGKATLQRIVATGTSQVMSVAFAVDFNTDQLEQLLAAVLVVKGSYEWNGKVCHN